MLFSGVLAASGRTPGLESFEKDYFLGTSWDGDFQQLRCCPIPSKYQAEVVTAQPFNETAPSLFFLGDSSAESPGSLISPDLGRKIEYE